MARKQKETSREPSKEYICPYCFAKVDLSQVHYICSGQTCARTFAATASSTRSADAAKYVTADGQNEIDYEKSLFYGGNKIFVILGPKSVGKSHYIAVLINQLKNYVSTEFNGVLNAATDKTTLKYRDMYYRRLFEEKRKLPATKSYDVSDDSREPLIYYLRLFDSERPKVFTFAFFDTAGEDLVSSDKMMSLSINSFISKAAGIVYLVDPLQIRYINQRIHVDGKPPVGPDVSDVLNNICQIIRTNNKLSPKAKIDIPLAVVLTKADVLLKNPEDEEEDKVLFGQCSSIHIPREHGKVDNENFEQIDAELTEYLHRCLGDNFIQTVGGFEDHCYFAVSALGCNPVGSSLPRGVTPMRVEDPFIWLLSKEGLQ